jgi:hypothetical protein
MTKRRKRSRTSRRPTGQPAPGRTVSAAYVRVVKRIVDQGPAYVKDSFVRLLQSSADLRTEPEFADLYLDPVPLLEAAARHYPRFRRRAKRAMRRNDQEVPSLYDDYRIAVLDDLDTLELRRELRGRLDRCLDRLKYGDDEIQIEAAVLTSMLLSDEASQILNGKRSLPLGLYGLVTALHEDSFDRAMEAVPDARDTVGDELYALWCDRHQEEDLDRIEAAVKGLVAFEELASRRESDRALALAWMRQEDHLHESLGLHIADGALSIEPRAFSPDEISLAIERMERRHWRKPWSPSRYMTAMAVLNLLGCIREAVNEIVSPERIAGLVEAFTVIGRACVESDDERKRSWVPAVQAGIDDLVEAESPSQSRVLLMLYLQGLIRALNEAEAPSPHWRRLYRSLMKSRLYRQMSEEYSWE